ncbi:MAG: CPBP family intramembrane metalloprotease, partial [Gloeomargaritaceae cyanobacterium C42_A2020_066]|nr:CPBP family intramembrane metalloprotease [Gloeomargaritaceae cyanobacterium C42_A2020_066]
WASLCFGVLHLVGLSQWPYALWATVVGFGLGAAGLGTGNLLVPVIAHGVTNWIGSLVWKARHGRPAAPP